MVLNLRAVFAAVLLSGCGVAVTGQPLFDTATIRTIEVTTVANWRTVMASNYSSKTYIKADVKIDDVVYKDVGVRHRGFSTYRFLPSGKSDKRPWKLAFDEFVAGQKAKGYRTLNITNNVWDPSCVREVVGYEFMRQFIPAPQSCYVKLVVNTEDLGLFTLTEQINKDFLDNWFRDDAGNRYRGERPSSQTAYDDTGLNWLGTSLSRYQAAYELKTENGLYPPWTKLIDAIDKLNNTPSAQAPTVVPSVIDVDDALRFLAVLNITATLDSYIGRVCKNFYVYEDPFHGRLRFQPWDVNNGLGGLPFEYGLNGIASMSPFHYEGSSSNPRGLLTKLLQRPEWRARYLAHYRSMLRAFDWSTLGARIVQLRTMIRPLLVADSKRIYSMSQFDQALTQNVNVGFVTVPALQTFVQNRYAYLAAHSDLVKVAPTLTNLAHAPASPGPQQPVWVTVAVSGATATTVTLYYRTRGPFTETPMFDDGQHGDGQANDGVYGAAIPPQSPLDWVEYYVGANGNLGAGGAMAFAPTMASFQPPGFRVGTVAGSGPIRISEFLAKNDNGLRDELGERDDWLELINTGSAAVDVSGMYLTDDAGNPTKWPIPTGTVLQPGQTLLVWCDEDGNQGPMHANFKLAAGGEEVALFATDGTTNLDWIGFGTQQGDVSSGRLDGHGGFLVTFPTPTPSQPNRAEPCGHLAYGGADPMAARVALAAVGTPSLGQTVSFQVSQAPASTAGVFALAGAPFAADILGLGPLLVNPAAAALLPMSTDAAGAAIVPIAVPNAQVLVGASVYVQAFVFDGTTGGLSSAIATRICP